MINKPIISKRGYFIMEFLKAVIFGIVEVPGKRRT